MPIDTVEDLRDHVALAIEVELSTIPPYLYALYSIEDQTSEAALLIKSIVAEEMLHAALGANLLLAVGGEPSFSSPDLLPGYPGLLPHHRPDLMLNLEPCSLEAITTTFMVLERPEQPGAPPEADDFESLGQFYAALELAIERLPDQDRLFADPQTSRQLSDPAFYAPVAFDAADSGGLILIDSADRAREAIEIIIHQGEGLSDEKWADPSHQELTHYHKLLLLARGATPLGRVRPAIRNPRSSDYPDPIRPVSDLFNAAYRYLFLTLDELYSGAERSELVGRMYALMSRVLRPVARHLMALPLGDGRVAGPTFEGYRFDGTSPRHHLLALAEAIVADHPQLGELPAVLAEI